MLTVYKVKRLMNLTTRDIHVMGNDENNWEYKTGKPLAKLQREINPCRLNMEVKVNYGITLKGSETVIPVGTLVPDKVFNLPPEEEGTFYIVPRIVAEELKNIRKDLFIILGKLWENKTTIGVRSLVRL